MRTEGKRSFVPREAWEGAAGPQSERMKKTMQALKLFKYNARSYEPRDEMTRTIQINHDLSRFVSTVFSAYEIAGSILQASCELQPLE